MPRGNTVSQTMRDCVRKWNYVGNDAEREGFEPSIP